MRRSALPFVILSTAFLLPACSGGGGSDGSDGVNTFDGTADSTDGGTDDGTGPGDTGDDGMGACENEVEAGAITYKKIATWRDDATAAYSMIHDDMCGPALAGIHNLAVPALEERGLTAALGPFVDACESANLWDVVRDAESKGNEIVNHSATHPNITVENAAEEVTQAKADFDAELETPVEFYIFPFDYWTPETLAAVGNAGHIGARAGNRDDNDGFENPPLNGTMPDNDLEIEFDVWPRTYSKYASYYPADILSVHAWNAIEAGGWAVREFHSVSESDDPPNDGSLGFGPVPISTYGEHLDFLAAARDHNDIWTANPSTVIRYRHARTACSASVSETTIEFDTSNPDCTTFHTPISVIVETENDVEGIQATQAGEIVRSRKIGPSEFAVTADPTLGPVEIDGCADAGLGVGVGPAPAGKPSPADSVCDIQTVMGSGSPGLMDDLERPPEEFQVFPNPAQGDGRDGSWSWYPQNITVEIADDGGNNVLHYAASNLAAWTGVTLAFLGGNGAGACYDASVYTGVRFRIRGSVATPDALNNKVIVSMVTAETQTNIFGGDLEGMGGHFNLQIDVTDTWATVEIPWGNFNVPTWGDTTGLSSLALGKLQAIDWGISDTATNFEIYLDDIELY
jgi:hypothetical protein